MKLYMFRTVHLSIISSLFTVHSAMVYVIQVGRQLLSRSICSSCRAGAICSTAVYNLKECHPRCVYQIYSRSKIREVAVKKHNYNCRYNNLPTTCFGRDRPSSGWDTTSEEYICKRDLVPPYLYL